MIVLARQNLMDLPTSIALTYFWCGGFMLAAFLVVQIVSGVILSFLYVADVEQSFDCVLSFNGENFFGWVVRYFHIWGVSAIFFLILIHMGRGFYYSSYSKFLTWNVGFLLYLMMMVEAFLGYILPWHQMSYWAATVITSVLASIPIIGLRLCSFLMGGYGVTNVTLVRVFSAHVLVASVIVGLSVLHLYFLHEEGSSNPLCIENEYGDAVSFTGYFLVKDGLVFCFLLVFLLFNLLLWPDLVLDAESYVEADPMMTPITIKPEWYFLAFYAMLRSVESKIGGLLLVLVFIFIFWLPTSNLSCAYSEIRQHIFWNCCSVYVVLTYLGSCHPESPFVFISKVLSLLLIGLLFMFKLLWVTPYAESVSLVERFIAFR